MRLTHTKTTFVQALTRGITQVAIVLTTIKNLIIRALPLTTTRRTTLYPLSTIARTKSYILTLLLTTTLLAPLPTAAQTLPDFEINTRYSIEYTPNTDYVKITEKLQIKANNPDYYFPAQEEQTFELPDFNLQKNSEEREFKIDSVQVKDEFGRDKIFTTKEHETGITIKIRDAQDITFSNDYEITVSYKTHELLDQNGNITNLYIPGLPKDTKFETTQKQFNLKTVYNYQTELIVPSTAPEASYIKPATVKTRKNGATRIYSIEQEERVGETAWIQLGTKQYYYFKMIQKTPKTDILIPESISKYSDLLSTNVYTIPLPKEHEETEQEVFFKSITPEPQRIERDKEGNIIATFEVPANEDGEIVIEGYITLNSAKAGEKIPDISLAKYQQEITNDTNLTKYTLPDLYWESDSSVVREAAESIAKSTNSLLELVKADYQYVIDQFDYSYEKVAGENPRIGALAALTGGQAVCMEYSDATIALLRAQGIPARAAVGYGNDPTGAENVIGDSQAVEQNIGHQWLQVWVPEYGWLSVDPTWGESGRTYIGGNLDHILWYTLGDAEGGFIGTALNSADPVLSNTLQSYDVYLQALPESKYPGEEQLLPLTQFIDSYDDVEYDKISFFLKTTMIGKALVILIPIAALFMILMMFISLLLYGIRKATQKESLSQATSRA